MPEYRTPGVDVEETSSGSKSIEGISTSAAGFIGPCHDGPTDASPLVTSLADFERIHGGGNELRLDGRAVVPNYTWHAARAFFEEGGRRLYVARVSTWRTHDCENALKRLEASDEISIVAAPGSTAGTGHGNEPSAIASALLEHVARIPSRFAVLDSGAGQSIDSVRAMRTGFQSAKAALYYPWVRVKDPVSGGNVLLPPSGFVAGIYARVDLAGGVNKAPANEVIRLAIGLEHEVTDAEQKVLNAEDINCIRFLPAAGFRVWGARTLGADPEWKYVNVRRYGMFLETSIARGVQWAVFEPNGEALWATVRRTTEDFLLNEWKSGRLAGSTQEHAFFVKCDRTTMTQLDVDEGRLVALVGVAMVRPAEFVIFRIGQWTADHK
jgi:phage tail sheath protein FI